MAEYTISTEQPYRYAVNDAGLAYARVRFYPDGRPNLIEGRVYQRRGRSHWRRLWRYGQPKPMSNYCKKILADARCV